MTLLWLSLNHYCAVSAYFQVFPYSLLLCMCYCMVLWLTSAQTCLKTPGDVCSSSRKSIYCIYMQGCPLVEWMSTKWDWAYLMWNFISTVWVLTREQNTWDKPNLYCCRLNLALTFGCITPSALPLPLMTKVLQIWQWLNNDKYLFSWATNLFEVSEY